MQRPRRPVRLPARATRDVRRKHPRRRRPRAWTEPEEIYFRYYLKFDEDWKRATSGGKLPGMSGTYGKAGWGGRPVHGDDGWSARGLYVTRPGDDSTAIGFYCYHADMRGKY